MSKEKISAKDVYFVDCKQRVENLQASMKKENIDVYLGSRLRTVSWLSDAFCPWRTYVVVFPDGNPTVFTFTIDAARVADDSWLPNENVLGYGPIPGMDQIGYISKLIKDKSKPGKIRIGIETGMSNYLPEGNLTLYEYEGFKAAIPDAEFINAHNIVDNLSLIKDEGTINRFREASRIVDIGQKAVYDAIKNGGYKGKTETELAGIASYAMRKAGSEWEWSFTGGNEIASGYRTGFFLGACTPASRRELKPGEALMIDLHAMFKLGLGDHAHNYLIAPATEKQKWHAKNFLEVVNMCINTYKAGVTPGGLCSQVLDMAREGGYAEYLLPGFEHGIGLMGDEWRIGLNDGPLPYWTNPGHAYKAGEMLICAIQYACPQDNVGFRYESPILITEDGCEVMNKFPLDVEVIE